LPEEIPLFQQPTLVSQFGISWVRDTRDNPADATKGTLNSADFGVADTYFGSSASFTHFLFQNSSYYPIKKRFSFARSIRIGVLNPYRDTVSLTFLHRRDRFAASDSVARTVLCGRGNVAAWIRIESSGSARRHDRLPGRRAGDVVTNQEFVFQ